VVNQPGLARRDARRLRRGLGEEDAGHQRVPGEMAAEERLRRGKALRADRGLSRLDGDDRIDEDKRLAVRQTAGDGVQRLHAA
jgi:hypothetical protein